ncbi:hypothetical protein [Thermalbibacter longus]|nr:hypothetical protein [Thermalbibacter longus]
MSTELRLSEQHRAVLLALLREAKRPLTTEELAAALREAAQQRAG